jgi:hypothetical protein
MSNSIFRSQAVIRWICLVFCFLSYSFLSAEENQPKKVALLFLTRNGVNHPNLWKELLTEHADKFNVYIHAGTMLADPFFESFRLKTILPTSWDHHINAWQLLVQAAYKNEENYKFVFLSESCAPLFPLEVIHEALITNDLSYMCFARPWWPKDNIREVIWLPEKHRWGNHEWVILNRKHAEMVAKDDLIVDIVSHFWIDAESYPSTLFSVEGCLHEFACRTTTYVNWPLSETGAHPYAFTKFNHFNLNLLLEGKKQGHFFARKIAASFPEEGIRIIMRTDP